MSTTIEITFDNVEAGRVRAQINGDGTGQFGVFAEAPNPQDAAAQAVKTFFALNPVRPSSPSPMALSAVTRWVFSQQEIRAAIKRAINAGDSVRIEYVDDAGHETTRTIDPSAIKDNDRVIAYDHLREGVRAFLLGRIKAARAF